MNATNPRPICARFWLLASAVAFIVSGGTCWGQEIFALTPLKPDGIYAVGEKLGWTVSSDAGELPITYTLKKNGLAAYETGALPFAHPTGRDGQPQSPATATIETSLDEPGAVLLEIKTDYANLPRAGRIGGGTSGTARVLAGALVAPQKLQPSSPRPPDFDAWWAAKVNQLHAIPVNAQLTPAESGKSGVDYALIKMDNCNGAHIQGQLAAPTGGGKHPALLMLQWAGVYSLPASRVTDRAAQGWIALNLEPHDIPSNQPDAFYKNLQATTLKNYQAIGQEDREKSYFLAMYLGAYRALDYLAARDDWDGKTLVVQGTSMGGQQSLSMAGLHPKVSAVIVMVPSGCDVTGPEHGSAAGFPDWARDAKSKANPKILETARYFDPVNFSSHTKAPALVAMGLLDETSPPAGVWRAINQMQGLVEPLPMVNSPHQDTPVGVQKPYQVRAEEWLRSLLITGRPPPSGHL
jgi:cephalosporin-C deacetylase-like acetyl esterase